MPPRVKNPTEKQLTLRAKNKRALDKVKMGLKSDDPVATCDFELKKHLTYQLIRNLPTS